MNNIFNSLQTHITGEDCKKFSKSVSYETLVGGTPATGTGIKQILRVFLSSADKPLSAVGTLTSLLCNSAKVFENLLKMPLVFKKVCESERMGKFVAVSMLVAVLSTFYVSESWAVNCATGKKVCQTGCIDETLTCEYCGPTCGYTQVDGEVTIYGTGEAFSGYQFYNAPFANKSVTNVKADDSSNFTSIGNYAFYNATSLQSVNMPNITSIGTWAFLSTKLTSVDISNITTLGNGAFFSTSSLAEIIISDEIDITEWNSSAFDGIPTDAKITCWGVVASCATELRKKYSDSIVGRVQAPTAEQCNASESYYSTNDGCVKLPSTQDNCTSAGFSWVNDKCTKTAPAAPEPEPQELDPVIEEPEGSQVSGQATSVADCAASGKYWQEGKCVSSCGASFKFNDGWCDRQRYTPAEAAEVLRNDNTNEVTITFKK